MNPVTIPAKLFNSRRYFSFIMLFLAVAIALSALAAWRLQTPFLTAIGILISLVFLILLKNQLAKSFSQEINITLTKDAISIDYFHQRTHLLEKSCMNRFEEIESFRMYDAWRTDSSVLTFKLNNGKKKSYSILEYSEDSQQQLSEAVFHFIRLYNDTHDKQSQIIYTRNIFYHEARSKFYPNDIFFVYGINNLSDYLSARIAPSFLSFRFNVFPNN